MVRKRKMKKNNSGNRVGKSEKENMPFKPTPITAGKDAFDLPAARGDLSKGMPVCLNPAQLTSPRKNLLCSDIEETSVYTFLSINLKSLAFSTTKLLDICLINL